MCASTAVWPGSVTASLYVSVSPFVAPCRLAGSGFRARGEAGDPAGGSGPVGERRVVGGDEDEKHIPAPLLVLEHIRIFSPAASNARRVSAAAASFD